MTEFIFDATWEARTVPALLQRWASVSEVPELTFVLPEEPLHPAALVLLGSMASDRRLRGLINRAKGQPAADPAAQRLLRTVAPAQGPDREGEADILGPVCDRSTARKLADTVADSMLEVAPAVSPSIVRMARFVFEELGVNIVDHSDRPETGYGFAAIDPSRRRLELAFADAGIGFRASLQRNPELEGRVPNDDEALQLALTPHISGTSAPRRNMGWGLKQLTEFSDLLGGDLWIASGSAMLLRRTTAGQRANVIRSIPPWRGSWISLEGPVG